MKLYMIFMLIFNKICVILWYCFVLCCHSGARNLENPESSSLMTWSSWKQLECKLCNDKLSLVFLFFWKFRKLCIKGYKNLLALYHQNSEHEQYSLPGPSRQYFNQKKLKV